MRSVSNCSKLSWCPTTETKGLYPRRGGIGEPRKASCVSCLQSNSQCVLAESRRGGNFRRYEPNKKHPAKNRKAPKRVPDAPPMALESMEREPKRNGERLNGDAIVGQLVSELRNPSDALHILAQSEKGESAASSTLPEGEPNNLSNGPSNATFLDEYKLVESGLIHRTAIFELLHMSVNRHKVNVARPLLLTRALVIPATIILIVPLCRHTCLARLLLTEFSNPTFSCLQSSSQSRLETRHPTRSSIDTAGITPKGSC